MSNHIVIKGKKDRLEINLDPKIDFLTLSEKLASKLSEARAFIGKSNLAIEFAGRPLSTEEENILIKVVTENSDIVIAYVFSEKFNKEDMRYKLSKPLAEEGKTYFYRGTLRSGAKIEYDGNIVIMGDVNPGAIVKAKGNILVIGHLNGTVYAGLNGEPDAFVSAAAFNPIQITIGIKTINNLQKEILDSNRVKKSNKFKIAHIKNQELIIEEL
ncbi:MAG: septum site-determining protein MinC [Fusobacterium sp.]|uniref:septum site-determining protein MinC n=1 Tax=Fusobacterium sp. TaxID=68766 RepID=UPI0026DB5D32|nr:septum site-determining protein MinC [Fusobacterium sp.]MDO4690911.1 septum site-determining protein MinC [Fusobacterium sp.]